MKDLTVFVASIWFAVGVSAGCLGVFIAANPDAIPNPLENHTFIKIKDRITK